MTDPQLHPEARHLLDRYLEEHRSRQRRSFVGAVIAFAIANLALVFGVGGQLLDRVEAEAVAAAKEQVKSEADGLAKSAEDAYAIASEQIKAHLGSITASLSDVYQEVGATKGRTEALQTSLDEARDRFNDSVEEAGTMAGQIRQDHEQARRDLAELRDTLASTLTRVDKERTRLNTVAGQLAELQSVATNLSGEDGTRRLQELRELADLLNEGEPLAQLSRLRSDVEVLRDTVESGEFQQLRCTALELRDRNDTVLARIGPSSGGASVELFNHDGGRSVHLETTPAGDGHLWTFHQNGTALTRLGANRFRQGGFWLRSNADQDVVTGSAETGILRAAQMLEREPGDASD